MQRKELLGLYSNAYQQLIDALDVIPGEMWQFKPAPEKWSVHEVLIHIADSEVNSFARARKIICESGSTIMAYDENAWAVKLNYHDQSIEDSLELFRQLRMMTYNIIKELPEETWQNFIIHPDNGKMTLDDWLKVYADHIPVHIKQIKRNLDEWEKLNS
jgi:uncharacterized damage-inducible protein DinB